MGNLGCRGTKCEPLILSVPVPGANFRRKVGEGHWAGFISSSQSWGAKTSMADFFLEIGFLR